MIVLDASAALDALLGTERAQAVLERVADPREPLIAPDILLVEVGRVLRRHAARSAADDVRSTGALVALLALDIDTFPSASLLPRAWALRANVTLDDALYVTLAEVAEAPLLTSDQRLAAAAREHTAIVVETV